MLNALDTRASWGRAPIQNWPSLGRSWLWRSTVSPPGAVAVGFLAADDPSSDQAGAVGDRRVVWRRNVDFDDDLAGSATEKLVCEMPLPDLYTACRERYPGQIIGICGSAVAGRDARLRSPPA